MNETWLSIPCRECNRPIARGFTGEIPVSVRLKCNDCNADIEYQTDQMNQEDIAPLD